MSKFKVLAIPFAIIIGSTFLLSGPLQDPPAVQEATNKRRQKQKQEFEDAITAKMVARIEKQFPEVKDEK